MHDYSPYHYTSGFERIGDMIGAGDFACYNATIFYQEVLMTDTAANYRTRSFSDFINYFAMPQNYKIVIVSSIDEAYHYLKDNHIDILRNDAIYISQDYQITKINPEFFND